MQGKPVEERTIDNEEKSIYANRQTEIKVNMDISENWDLLRARTGRWCSG